MSKKIDEYPILKKEVEKKDKVVHLKYVDEVLAKQIEEDIEKDAEFSEKIISTSDPFRFAGYDPNVIDFIRRCDTLDQAMEILDYLENIGDISTSEGDKLRKRLKTEGLRSFGPKKKKGFYFTRDE
ncbi:MAG: DUF2095 family protein [Candidatus Heimdallarchaeota archaeon]|nr:DUF2095 domain-containing protein [Candidatus Heimdallarchaeota archaeon]MCG3253576.1 DUF2095 family protein [Candidatus Heimdallarchaeota archaeon]MCK4290713.1 DUF2095 family protein [Candidatus Heimdallarchaeota archaeon]